MSTRMVLSIAFVLFVVLGMLVYTINDNTRAEVNKITAIEKQAEEGAELFAANCSQCHGPKGEGAIGPALDRKEWHAENKEFDEASVTSFIRNVLYRGQYSPQPGINMPAWLKQYGGPLNEEEIENLIMFLTHGEWEVPLDWTATPNFIVEIPANEKQKAQYPSTTADVLRQQNSQKYGTSLSSTPEQKAALDADVKREDDTKGAAHQKAIQNREELRKLLGNYLPGEQVTQPGMKQLLLAKGCLGCHSFGSAGTTLGPNLTEVGSRRTSEWMYTWIKDPSAVAVQDRGPNLQPWFALNNRTEWWPMGPTYMPTIQMTDQERQNIVDYLADLKVAPTAPPKAATTENK
jgi:mono/diheme cytochrome c family protein